MASFLSESYLKPKLTESRFITKIIKEQNNKITFEKKAFSYSKNFILQYWKIIIALLVIISLFYWRYKEIKKIRNKKSKETVFSKSYNNNQYETSSESYNNNQYETSSES
jgi:hypothetical protein